MTGSGNPLGQYSTYPLTLTVPEGMSGTFRLDLSIIGRRRTWVVKRTWHFTRFFAGEPVEIARFHALAEAKEFLAGRPDHRHGPVWWDYRIWEDYD